MLSQSHQNIVRAGVLGLGVLLLQNAQAQEHQSFSESTVILNVSRWRAVDVHESSPSTENSHVFGGAGFIYGRSLSRYFMYESRCELGGGGGLCVGTLTANIVVSLQSDENHPRLFLGCGYGLSIPSVFETELLRIDVGTIDISGGLKIRYKNDHFLRIAFDYKRNRIYQNESGTHHTTTDFLGLQIGLGFAYADESD